jgi:hypothetical protein
VPAKQLPDTHFGGNLNDLFKLLGQQLQSSIFDSQSASASGNAGDQAGSLSLRLLAGAAGHRLGRRQKDSGCGARCAGARPRSGRRLRHGQLKQHWRHGQRRIIEDGLRRRPCRAPTFYRLKSMSDTSSPTVHPQIHWRKTAPSTRPAGARKRHAAAQARRHRRRPHNADQAYRLACEGTAMLWRGDFQNARQLLQALARRADHKNDKPAKRPRPPSWRSPNPPPRKRSTCTARPSRSAPARWPCC